MFASLKYSLRRAGFGLGGALFMLVGLAFLTVAAWIALAQAQGAMMAALIIGCAYVGVGAVIIALGTRRPRYVAPVGTRTAFSAGGLSAAFAQGFGAGAATRSAMRSRG